MRFWTCRRLPSLISISSSIGTNTSRIWSCMSMDSIRFSRFFLTFSSWPEYAWMTYHCASAGADATSALSAAIALTLSSLLLVDEVLGQLAEAGVDREDEERDDAHRHHDHQRVAVQLLGGRPDHLAQLLERLPQEPDDRGRLVGLSPPPGLDGHLLPRLPVGSVAAAPAA